MDPHSASALPQVDDGGVAAPPQTAASTAPGPHPAMPDDVAAAHANNEAQDGIPPQQVFVNAPSMAGLTSQFQTFGLDGAEQQQMPANAKHEGSDLQEDTETDTTATQQEQADHPLKLFVGQVPKSMNEEDIFPTFDKFGPLKDVVIIRDRNTNVHKGCAFVTYWSRLDGEQAREKLHDKFKFPGARRPAQVKPASPANRTPENKLFIGMLSRTAGEDEVRELFAPFGEIREIYMIRNHDGTSKCAAFLRFVERDSAVEAIQKLHSNIVMDGATRPLIVKFADTKQQRQQRYLRNVRRQEMMAAMNTPGYGPGGYAQIPPTLPINMHQAPHETQHYPMQHHQPYGHYAGNRQPPHPHAPPHPYMYAPQQFGPMPPYNYTNNRVNPRPNNPRPREGPAGANLFVYHLPHDLTDADLATAFNPFGNVISAKVYVDKITGESKGFGFVSYDSVISAESAIEHMNGFQIGTKRLKVQHKRVHNNHGGGGGGNNPNPNNPPPNAGPVPMGQPAGMPPQGMLNPAMPHHPQQSHLLVMPPQQQQPQHMAPQPPISGLKHGQPGLPSPSMPLV